MNKIVIYIISIFVLILVVFTTFINYKYYKLINKNSELKYLVERTGTCIDKNNVNNTILEYTKIRREELKADGIEPINIPPLSDTNKTKIISGYNPHLKFDESGKLKSFNFYNYKSDIKFVY